MTVLVVEIACVSPKFICRSPNMVRFGGRAFQGDQLK